MNKQNLFISFWHDKGRCSASFSLQINAGLRRLHSEMVDFFISIKKFDRLRASQHPLSLICILTYLTYLKQSIFRSAFTPKSFGLELFGVGRARQFLLGRLAQKLAAQESEERYFALVLSR